MYLSANMVSGGQDDHLHRTILRITCSNGEGAYQTKLLLRLHTLEKFIVDPEYSEAKAERCQIWPGP